MSELLSFFTLMVCFVSIFAMVKFFGKEGLFAYSAIAVIVSNIQVLKLTKYSLVDNPVAMGTVVFSTIFAVDNILTEHYGAKTARKCVLMSFVSYLFFSLVMEIAILHPVVLSSECLNLHDELKKIFSPGLIFFSSSLISFVASQMMDIFVFSTLKRIMKGKYVSFRALVSMTVSTFVDNVIFSVLAWQIFAENPVSFSLLGSTYIFTTYVIRLIVAVSCVPLVKLSDLLIYRKSDVQKF